MESKAYTLIEADYIGEMLLGINDVTIQASILCWVVDTVAARQEMQALPVLLELIVASYVGPYPCMALHYEDPTYPAYEELYSLVETWSEELVKSASFGSYADYVAKHGDRIKAFMQHYQAEVDAYDTLEPRRPVKPLPDF